MAPGLPDSAEPPATLRGRLGGAVILAAFAAATGFLALAPPPPPRVSLQAQASAVAAELEDELDAALGLLGPLRGRLRAGETPDWKVFEELVGKSPLRRPAQELIAWVPRVPAAARAGFEADSGRDAFRSLRIVEPRADGEALVPAQARAQHHPVALAAPLQPAAELLGLDVEALPELELALAAAATPPRAVKGTHKRGARASRGETARAEPRPALAGPLTLLPASACAGRARPGCAPLIFLVVPITRATAGDEAGFLLVGLSWSAVTRAGLSRAEASAAVDLLQPRAARARLRLPGTDTSWTLELREEPGRPRTARLGRASADAQ